MVMSFNLSESFGGPVITVYGNRVTDINFTKEQAEAAGLPKAEKVNGFARIRAYKIGSGLCVTLPNPVLIVVYGNGGELTEAECHLNPGEVLKWTYPLGSPLYVLEPSQGDAEHILETLATRGIDGGLNFENPRYENGKLCVDAHIWAKITVLGQSVRFDERRAICINVGAPCATVWSNAFASLEICYRAPDQICGKLCVGKFGLSKCWEKCASIPHAVTSESKAADHSCSCSGKQSQLAATSGCLDCDLSADATVRNRKIEVSLAGHGISFDAPGWLTDGTSVTVQYHGCGCYCTKGGRAELHFNGQRIACYTVWGDCDC